MAKYTSPEGEVWDLPPEDIAGAEKAGWKPVAAPAEPRSVWQGVKDFASAAVNPKTYIDAGASLRDNPEFMATAKGLVGIPATVAGVSAGLGSLAGGGEFGPAFTQGKAEFNADDARVRADHPGRYAIANLGSSMFNPLFRAGAGPGGAAFGVQQWADSDNTDLTNPADVGKGVGGAAVGYGGGKMGEMVADALVPPLTSAANRLWGKTTGATGGMIRNKLGGEAGLEEMGAAIRDAGVVGPTWNPLTWTRTFRNPASDIADRAAVAANGVEGRLAPIYSETQAMVNATGQRGNPAFQYDPAAVAGRVRAGVVGPEVAAGEENVANAAKALGDYYDANAANLAATGNGPTDLLTGRSHVANIGRTSAAKGAFMSPLRNDIEAPLYADAYHIARRELTDKTQAAASMMNVPGADQIGPLNRQMTNFLRAGEAANEAASRTAGHVTPSLRTSMYMGDAVSRGDIGGAAKALTIGEGMKGYFTPTLASGAELTRNILARAPRLVPSLSLDAMDNAIQARRRAGLGE